MTDQPLIRFDNVHLSYGDVVAVDGLDMALTRGQICALLGPNGAGKTTSVSMLLGLIRPDAGHIDFDGASPGTAAARRRTGAMLQTSGVPPTLRVVELIRMFATYYPAPLSTERVLALTKLGDLADRPFQKLSGGQQQRVLFALSICGDPDLLVLDEPTVGMDVSVRRDFWAVIRELADGERTVLLTTHYLEEADAVADSVVVLRDGKAVASGSPEHIKSTVGTRRVIASTTLDETTLATLPGATEIRTVGERIEILSNTPEALLREWLSLDRNLAGLEVKNAALEEAFLALTEKQEAEA